MKNSVCFLLGGQGSQYYGMGYELYKYSPIFRKTMDMLDVIYESISGYSVLKELFRYKQQYNRLYSIKYSHPAIFFIEYALAETLKENGIIPTGIIGASLGEYSALALGKVVSLTSILNLIYVQTHLLCHKCCKGYMITIMSEIKKNWFDDLKEYNEVISFNCKNHFIISGPASNYEETKKILNKNNLLYYILPVEYPFHTKQLDNFKVDYQNYFEQINISLPTINLYLSSQKNINSKLTTNILWESIRKPIYFIQTLNKMSSFYTAYIDLTPGASLKNIIIMANNTFQYDYKLFGIINPLGNEVENLKTILKV